MIELVIAPGDAKPLLQNNSNCSFVLKRMIPLRSAGYLKFEVLGSMRRGCGVPRSVWILIKHVDVTKKIIFNLFLIEFKKKYVTQNLVEPWLQMTHLLFSNPSNEARPLSYCSHNFASYFYSSIYLALQQ